MKLVYPAIFNKHSDNEIVVSFPDFPEALTSGNNHDNAKEEAQDALCEALAGRINREEDIPIPSTHEDSKLIAVSVPIEMALKVALYLGQKEANINKVGLASKLKCDEKQIRRLLNPYHHSKLPAIEEALNALNQQVELTIREVPAAA